MTESLFWKIIFTDCFDRWLNEQDLATKEAIFAHLFHLKAQGPRLSRPYADTVKGSQYPNMKELRVQHQGKPIRAFFAFDPLRQAVVLCAGDKSNDKRFYERMITLADNEFTLYLAALNQEK